MLLVIALVLCCALAGVFTTAAIIRRFAGTDPLPDPPVKRESPLARVASPSDRDWSAAPPASGPAGDPEWRIYGPAPEDLRELSPPAPKTLAFRDSERRKDQRWKSATLPNA